MTTPGTGPGSAPAPPSQRRITFSSVATTVGLLASIVTVGATSAGVYFSHESAETAKKTYELAVPHLQRGQILAVEMGGTTVSTVGSGSPAGIALSATHLDGLSGSFSNVGVANDLWLATQVYGKKTIAPALRPIDIKGTSGTWHFPEFYIGPTKIDSQTSKNTFGVLLLSADAQASSTLREYNLQKTPGTFDEIEIPAGVSILDVINVSRMR